MSRALAGRSEFAGRSDLPKLVASLIWLTSTTLVAATAVDTNDAAISYVLSSVTLESTVPSEVLIDRFFQEAVSADSIVFDRFSGPASQLVWARRQNDLGYGAFDRYNAEGLRMVRTIGFDSLRTAAIEVLPLNLWQDNWQGWLANLLTGTLGNPEEEHLQMTSISYSAVRSSWENVNEHGGIQWGFRPWRTSPYVYFLAHAGRLDGQPLVTFEGRAGYSLLGSTRMEARLTFQLPASFRIAGGASVDPGRMSAHDPAATHIAVTLERVIQGWGVHPDAVFFLGFRSGVNSEVSNARPDNMFLTGLSKRW